MGFAPAMGIAPGIAIPGIAGGIAMGGGGGRTGAAGATGDSSIVGFFLPAIEGRIVAAALLATQPHDAQGKRVSNHLFNERVVPFLQPDPSDPGSNRNRNERQPDAVQPRRDEPETGFSIRVPWRAQPETISPNADITGT